MGRYLLCPMTEGRGLGPVGQLLAVAEELTIRGHDCAFVANERHASLLAGLGFRCFVAPVPDKRDLSAPDFRLSDAARALGASDPGYFAKALAFEQDAVDEFRPQALVSAVKLTTAVTAKSRGLPLVSVAASTDSPTFTSPLYPAPASPDPDDLLPGDLAELLAAHGLADVRDVAELSYGRSSYRVAPYPRWFDPFLPTDRLVHVGPLLSRGLDLYHGVTGLPALPPLHPGERDLVVVYINRGSQPVDHYLDAVAHAATELPRHRFVVVEAAPVPGRAKPDNLTVLAAAPILRLLARAALFVTGGGYNGVMAALLTGTPIVALPGMNAERDFNARRIVWLGAGAMVDGHPAPRKAVVSGIGEVLHGASYRAAAGAAGAKLRPMAGPAGVAEILVSL